MLSQNINILAKSCISFLTMCGKTALKKVYSYKAADEIIPNDTTIFYLLVRCCICNAYLIENDLNWVNNTSQLF